MHRADNVIYRNKCKIYSKLRKEPFAFTVTTMRILLGSSNELKLNMGPNRRKKLVRWKL